jgi:hypothetical protein
LPINICDWLAPILDTIIFSFSHNKNTTIVGRALLVVEENIKIHQHYSTSHLYGQVIVSALHNQMTVAII